MPLSRPTSRTVERVPLRSAVGDRKNGLCVELAGDDGPAGAGFMGGVDAGNHVDGVS
jgi:hypothetical protein